MTETEQQSDTAAAPRRRRRPLRHGLRVLVLLAAAPLVFIVIAAAMMFDREITAPTWIKTEVEARAAEVLGGGQLSFGQITMSVGPDLHPRVVLTDTVLKDADGHAVARLAQVSGVLSPRGLVFRQSALFQTVEVQGVAVGLRRNADGSVAVAFERNAADAGQAASLPELIDRLDSVFDRPALEALREVTVAGLIINYADARAGRTWTVDDARLTLNLRGGRTRLSAEMAVLSGGAEVTALRAAFDSARGDRAATFDVDIDNVRSRDIASQTPALGWLGAVDAPVTATFRTSLDNAGALGPLVVDLTLGAGVLQPTPTTTPLAFRSAHAALTYDPAAGRIGFDDLQVASDWGSLSATGQALTRDPEGGLPQTLLGQFTFRDVALRPADLYPDPLSLAAAHVDLRLRLRPFAVDIGQVVIDDPDYPLVARGKVSAGPDGWEVSVDAGADRLTLPAVLAVWPEAFRPGTRRWAVENVLAGEMHDVTFGLRLRPGQPINAALGLAFANASVRYIPAQPPISAAAGYLSVVDHAFSLRLDRGTVAAPQGGEIALAGSTLQIPDVRRRPQLLDIELATESTVTAALAVLDARPFGFLSRAGMPVTLADGRALTRASISLPLVQPVPGAQVRYDATATLLNVQSTTLVAGRSLASAEVVLSVTNAGMAVTGPVTLDGVPISGRFSRGFGPESGGVAEVAARIELSERFLDAFNIALPPGSVAGAGQGDVTLRLQPDAPPAFTLRSDLQGVSLALPSLGWAKPRGSLGSLIVEGRLGARPEITRLAVGGGGLAANGSVTFRAGGGLAAATFSQVQLDNWLNAPITLRGRGPGLPPAVEVGGGLVDLRRARFGPGRGDGGPLQLALDRLQITEGIALTGFRGDFDGLGGFSGQFSGAVNGGPVVRGTVVPRNGRSAVRLVSDDAGGVASAAGFLRNASGGTLDLTLLPVQEAGTFDGSLAVRGLRLRDAPTMAALLDAISVVGLLQQLDGQGLAFDAVDARFRLTPQQVILTQSSAVGPGLGISLDGIYTLASKSFDFQGVVSPFYLINGIGSLLTRPGEGLIGFNFTVTGTPAAPLVNVNPLSALTPGMFREIFRRAPPQVSP